MPETTYFAHSPDTNGRWHPLAEHLRDVAALAAGFAGGSSWASEAALAGLLHDLGKYGDRFQARLHGQDSGLDHWSAGAWVAVREHRAIAAALAIAGHHVGLLRGNPDGLRALDPAGLAAHHPQHLSLTTPDLALLRARAAADGLCIDTPPVTVKALGGPNIAEMLDVRMLFSCLVDADFLDTEAHFQGTATGKCPRHAGPALDPTPALAALDAWLAAQVQRHADADASLRAARATLWTACTQAADQPPGCFTLTAPTGAGKTLAMLKFALAHARRHGLRRVVLAVPFLTIIEQTAAIYRAVCAGLPPHFVLEHHSLAGLGPETATGDAQPPAERERRLLAENWDAPIVITTNVQLLESLFSNRPGACRKLHRLRDAVILFDEAQSLPAALAVPTLAALSHLASAYGASVVFATATQPAFDTLDAAVREQAGCGWRPVELVPEHPALFTALRRVTVTWPTDGAQRTWDDLAAELATTEQSLVVVNLKRHALALLAALGDLPGVLHLSTNLCPNHRRAVLAEVHGRLQRGAPCRLISTQCVEAGVDVDFPRVYRAFGPLEAIAQAAGRCNREGRLRTPGSVVVFAPAETGDWRRSYPTFAYYQAALLTRLLLTERGDLPIDDPAVFRDYYRRLYDLADPRNQCPELTEAAAERDFAELARRYRLIDQDSINVLVPWAGALEHFAQLREQAETDGIDGHWMRAAQGLAVALYRPRPAHPAWSMLIPAPLRRTRQADPARDEWFILAERDEPNYDPTRGLLLPDSAPILIG